MMIMRRFLSAGLAGLLLACTAEEVIPPAPAGEEVFFRDHRGRLFPRVSGCGAPRPLECGRPRVHFQPFYV